MSREEIDPNIPIKGNWFWYFNSITNDKPIDEEICQKIINIAEDNWNEAILLNTETPYNSFQNDGKEKYRESKVCFTNEQWLFDLIWPFMEIANENAGWKYDLKACESLQITKYELGGYYKWHSDGQGPGSHPEKYNTLGRGFAAGSVRKLTMSMALNSDFEGGGFEIFNEKVPKLGRGGMIFFPSFVQHRVKPVKKGTRYSLIAWFVGPPFV